MKINANKAFLMGPVLASGVVGALAIVLVIGVEVKNGNDKVLTSSAAYSGSRYVEQMRGTTPADRFANYTIPDYEGDVWPRETGGDGRVTKEDYDLVGQFSVGSLVPSIGKEYKKADVAPKATGGDGLITVADWVQVGRYVSGLDPLQTASGPEGPAPIAKIEYECDVWPRETGGDGKVTKEDWELLGKFTVNQEKPASGIEFQKADSAPRASFGNGQITVSDVLQCGRYVSGLDPLTPANGPTEPVKANLECDVWPRETGGDGKLTKEDWDLIGQFSVGSQTPASGIEFQKADCAPKATGGDGQLNVADWVQAGRYSAGLDPVQTASGPTSPTQ